MISNVPSKAMKFRSKIVMTGVFSLLFAAVAVNFFKLSVIDNEKYQAMANEMHFGSIKISAHRGSIYDAEGTPLAKSASVYKIYLDPKRFKEEMLSLQSRIDRQTEQKKNGTYSPVFDDDGKQLDLLPSSAAAFRQDAANLLASKLGITLEDVNSAMEADNQYSILQDQVEKPVADEVLSFFNQ